MGVQGLWKLLAPSGRRVSIETLERRTLAVDVSIWLTQFLKAMRDAEGKPIKNAHLIGTLRRVAKLLFHRIRPVFVFDGGAPALKTRTLQSRRLRRDDAQLDVQRAAKRILAAQLRREIRVHKRKANRSQAVVDIEEGSDAEGQANEGKVAAGLADGFVPGSLFDAPPTLSAAAAGHQEDVVPASPGNEADVEWKPGEEDGSAGSEDEWQDADVDLPDNVEGLDVEVIASLPASMRKKVIEDAQRKQRLLGRERYMPVAADPERFSSTQIENFLTRSRFNSKILNMQGHQDSNQVGRMIASDTSRRYVLTKKAPEPAAPSNASTPAPPSVKDNGYEEWVYTSGSDSEPQMEQGDASKSGNAAKIDLATADARNADTDVFHGGGYIVDSGDGGGKGVPVEEGLKGAQRTESAIVDLANSSNDDAGSAGGFPEQVTISSKGKGKAKAKARVLPVDILSSDSDSASSHTKSLLGQSSEATARQLQLEEDAHLARQIQNEFDLADQRHSQSGAHQGEMDRLRSEISTSLSRSRSAKPVASVYLDDGDKDWDSGDRGHRPQSALPSSSRGSRGENPLPTVYLNGDNDSDSGVRGQATGLQSALPSSSLGSRSVRPLPTVYLDDGDDDSDSGLFENSKPGSKVTSSHTGQADFSKRQAATTSSLQAFGVDDDVLDWADGEDSLGEEEKCNANSSSAAMTSTRHGQLTSVELDLSDLPPGINLPREGVGAESDFASPPASSAAKIAAGNIVPPRENDYILDWEDEKRLPAASMSYAGPLDVPAQKSHEAALDSAIATASKMANWAGRVVSRVLKEHRQQPLNPGPPNMDHSNQGNGRATSEDRERRRVKTDVINLTDESAEEQDGYEELPQHSKAPLEKSEDDDDDDSALKAAISESLKRPETSLTGGQGGTGVARDEEEAAELEAAIALSLSHHSCNESGDISPVSSPQARVEGTTQLALSGTASHGSPALPSLYSAIGKNKVSSQHSEAASTASTTASRKVRSPGTSQARSPPLRTSPFDSRPAIREYLGGNAGNDLSMGAEAEFDLEAEARADAADHQDEAAARRDQARALRDSATVTDEMREDVMQLLDLFGVPYIVAPMEAEAQCAELEKLGLVDGVITDDSDAFVFGSQTVYKNIFDDKKYVQAYLLADITKELGLGTDEMQALAILLGSDYTEGVKGIGIVNAMEILDAFPLQGKGPEACLTDFRTWLEVFDPEEEKKVPTCVF
jgi:5'-3' exonuclease